MTREPWRERLSNKVLEMGMNVAENKYPIP